MMSSQLLAALADMALSLGRFEEALMLIDEAYKAAERSLAQYSSRTPEESQVAPLGRSEPQLPRRLS